MKKIHQIIKNKYHHLNFREKTLAAFIVVSLVPFIILGSFCLVATHHLLITQEKNNMKSTLEQSTLTLNNQLDTYNKMLNSLCYNKELMATSNMPYLSNYDLFQKFKYIDDLFIMTQNLATGIDGITLYTDTSIPKHGKTVIPIEKAKSFDWYSRIIKSTDINWIFKEDRILCTRRILNVRSVNEQNNFIVLEINRTTIFRNLEKLSEQGVQAMITDSNNQVVFTNDKKTLNASTIEDMILGTSTSIKKQGYISMKSELSPVKLNLVLYTSYSKITKPALFITFIIVLILIFCFVLVFIISKLFSAKMVYGINCLRENMYRIEQGTLEVTVTSDSDDEIGELIKGFQNMVEQINHLIKENYIAKISQREYELKALQAQINPHFLYNSLSLINWRALRIHASDISEMAQLLSSFYRTTLNKGNNMITVADELLNVQSYLKIQSIMHSGNFDIEYQIDQTLSSYYMPNLMLQPLVENSILHGMEHKELEQGKIILSCGQKEDCMVFTIQDNGIGIKKDQLPHILEKSSNGYGIQNINERAKLIYGEGYGLSIDSIYNLGTTVILTIPIHPPVVQ